MVLVMSASLRTLIGSAIRESWHLVPECLRVTERISLSRCPDIAEIQCVRGAKNAPAANRPQAHTMSYREADLLGDSSL
jgi:hypothetical protein